MIEELDSVPSRTPPLLSCILSLLISTWLSSSLALISPIQSKPLLLALQTPFHIVLDLSEFLIVGTGSGPGTYA